VGGGGGGVMGIRSDCVTLTTPIKLCLARCVFRVPKKTLQIIIRQSWIC